MVERKDGAPLQGGLVLEDHARHFVEEVQSRGMASVISGVKGRWHVDPQAPSFPVADMRKVARADRCYFFCPETQWVDYGLDEARRHLGRPVHAALRTAAPFARGLVRLTGWGEQVQINAWGFSTQLVGEEDGAAVHALVDRLLAKPGVGTVCLRSVCAPLAPDLWHDARALRVPTRQVWLWEGPPSRRQRPDFWADRKLLATPGWTWTQGAHWDADDFVEAAGLYDALYRKKYSPLNPHYTPAGLRLYARCGVDFWMLRDPHGRPAGMVGLVERHGTLAAPFFGVDTSRPQEEGIYRRLSAWVFQEAERRGCGAHMSAGAARFKELRGARPHLEATLFWSHPRVGRDWARRAVRGVCTRTGERVLASRF